MKAIEQYFHMVLLIMLYKVVPTLKSLDETPVSDHPNESCWAVLSCVNYAGSNSYHHFRWYPTLENKTPAETIPKFPLVFRVIDRSSTNYSQCDLLTFLRHAIELWLVVFDPICQ